MSPFSLLRFAYAVIFVHMQKHSQADKQKQHIEKN